MVLEYLSIVNIKYVRAIARLVLNKLATLIYARVAVNQ